MNTILLTLGSLTLGGSAAILLLALAGRSIRGRYGAKWRCWGWLLLCLRLALPFPLLPYIRTGAPIRVDIPNPPAVTQPSTVPNPPNNPNVPGTGNASASQGAAQGNPDPPVSSGGIPSPAPLTTERELDPARVALSLWLLGACAVLARNGAAHVRFLSYLRRWSSPVADSDAVSAFNRLGDQLGLDRRPRLLVCQGLKVPMLAGIFRPAILLPQGNVSGEELGFSLLHELTHYRRRDIWLKTLVMWVNALYWFNPLAWYMLRLVERDTELACDEDALSRLSRSDYSAYGQTILAAVARLQNRERIETDE
ncbi:MAG: M56 family metallopeptidase [Lawsonibacter sp.]|jgi:beta-lactamase regulating signal transducer with metallopeptidase domain|nr:M56 family metallopeptidase [Lawsonibacter sp.]